MEIEVSIEINDWDILGEEEGLAMMKWLLQAQVLVESNG